MVKSLVWRLVIFVSVLLALVNCGGGGGGSKTPATPTTQSINGSGVKGPLAGAVATIYAIDYNAPGFKGAVIDTGETNSAAQITGVALPLPLQPPYLMEITSDADTVDITTGMAPVIGTLRTVITDAMLSGGAQLYATPQTTIATDMALAAATDDASLITALPQAAAKVMSSLGFGASSAVDIFNTPPLINAATDTTDEQAAVADYRTAIEALTAVIYNAVSAINGGGGSTTVEDFLADLANDLSDGVIDTLDPVAIAELTKDPTLLTIPNTSLSVQGGINDILVSEKATTGATTPTPDLEPGGTIEPAPKPAETDTDLDNDTYLNSEDNCPNLSNDQTDQNANTIGDACEASPVIDGTPDSSVDEGAFYTFTPTASDADNDTLSFAISGMPGWASFDASNGTLSGTPGFSDSGVYNNIDISVSDGSANPDVSLGAFSIIVNNVNIPPTIDAPTAANLGAVENILYSYTPTVDDADGNALTCSAQSIPVWANFDVPSCTLSGTPLNQHVGNHTGVSLCVTDSISAPVCQEAFTIVVANTNNAPTITGTPEPSGNEDSVYSFAPIIGDIDVGASLSCQGVSVPVWASVDPDTCELSGTPLNQHVATYNNIQVCVSDTFVSICTDPFSITVNNTQDPPTIGNIPVQSAYVGGNYSITPIANDPDANDILVFSINNLPANYWALFDTSTGELSGTPAIGDVGTTAGIQICVTDQNGAGTEVCMDPFDLIVSDVSPAVNISGIWHLENTVTSPRNCTTGATGDADYLMADVGLTRYIAFTQSGNGTDVTLTYQNGITTSGTIPVTTIEMPSPAIRQWTDTRGYNTSISYTFTGDYVAGDNTIIGSITHTTVNGDSNCSQTFDFVATHVHTPAASLDAYSGVYDLEEIIDKDTGFTNREYGPLHASFSGSDMTIAFNDGGYSEITIPLSYDPATGIATFNNVDNYFEAIDTCCDMNDLIHEVQDHVIMFVRDPADNSGPTFVSAQFNAVTKYLNTATYNPAQTPDIAENGTQLSYARMTQPITTTRNNSRINSSGALDNAVMLQLLNPPLLGLDNGDSTSFTVVQDSNGFVACSGDYGSRYTSRISLPLPDMTQEAFSDIPYSWINCRADPGVVLDNGSYTVNIYNSAGLLYSYPLTATKTTFDSSIPSHRDININGAMTPRTMDANPYTSTASGSIYMMFGYFNFNKEVSLSIPETTEAELSTYRLRFRNPEDFGVLADFDTTSSSFTIPADTLNEFMKQGFDGTLQLQLRERFARAPDGRIAQSLSHWIEFNQGVNGLVNVVVTNDVSGESVIFQVLLTTTYFQSANAETNCYIRKPLDGSIACNEINYNAINYNTDTVTIPITFNGQNTQLAIAFSDSVAGNVTIQDAGSVWNGTASVVNPELFTVSQISYTGAMRTDIVYLNPLFPVLSGGNGVLFSASGQDLGAGLGVDITLWNNDYASVYNSAVQIPLTSKQTGAYVAYSSSGVGVLSADTLTLSDNGLLFSKTYNADDPSSMLPPDRSQITIDFGAGDVSASAYTYVAQTEITAQPISLSWTHTPGAVPADTRWQIRLREVLTAGNDHVPHSEVRTKRLADGEGGLSYDSNTGRWTWIVGPEFAIPSTGIWKFNLRASNPSNTIRGLSQGVVMVDQVPNP